ncbi:nuclear transport factor 2 family protein [Vibrio cholerae]|uniref:YybH family protein n=1 Tax=Vibrio cholerae TaxID=666 RepID=UPI003700C1C6|nr:nuclear transport factor 2 family protein [Vibrio cholerae]
MLDHSVLAVCMKGIEAWQNAFNQQDAQGCAEQYATNAIMYARPFGQFEGREAIQAFWQNIMDQGFAQVEYHDVQWQAAGENGYILTAKWQMNKAFGAIHREHWVVEADGKARLASDDFEVLGER